MYSRRRVLGAVGAASVGSIAGCAGGPEVPGFEAASGGGGGVTRYGYRRSGLAIPERPGIVAGRLSAMSTSAGELAGEPHELLANQPLSDVVGDALDVESARAFGRIGRTSVFVGVDVDAVGDAVRDAGESKSHEGVEYYEGEEWAVAVTDDAVVETTVGVLGDLERRQYLSTVVRARRGDVDRLLDVDGEAARVTSVLPESEYVEIQAGIADLRLDAVAFGVSFRGESAVLSTAKLASETVDPSKREARLQTVEDWQERLTPDGQVSNITTRKDRQLVRVTGTVDASDVELLYE